MEYSLNTTTAFLGANIGSSRCGCVSIESMVHRFINESIVKRVQSSSQQPQATNTDNSVNQHLRDVIERYIAFASSSAPSASIVSATKGVMSTAFFTAPSADSATTNITPYITNNNPTQIAIKAEELTHYDDDVSETKAKGARKIHCSECPKILLSRKNFIKHAEDEHGMSLPIIHKSFDEQKEFDKWMAYLREERQTEFVSKCGRKRLSNGSLLGYLVCSKGGCGGELGSRKKTAKSLKTCAAYLKVLRSETSGRIDVEGCIEHTGHDLTYINTTALNNNNINNNNTGAESESSSFMNREELIISSTKNTSLSSAVSYQQSAPVSAIDIKSTALTQRTYGCQSPNMATASAVDASALEAFAALCGGFSNASFGVAPSSNSSALSVEIICGFLNAMRQTTGDFPSVVLPSQMSTTQMDHQHHVNLTTYHNAPTPPSSTTTFATAATVAADEFDANGDDIIASNSGENAYAVMAQSDTARFSPDFTNMELERRKLTLIETFQTSIKKVDRTTIDGAEVAMRFFVRELDGLLTKNSS